MLPITKLCTAFCVGVLVHVGLFKKGEWHLEAPRVLVLHALVFTAIVIMDARTTEQSSLYNSYCVVLGYLSGLFSSIVTYRLSPWHRLHDFPGPRLAAVSKFWHVWQCRDSRNHELMERLHNQYGDFVRIGPSEVASFHPESFMKLEGNSTQCKKSDFYDLMLPDFSLVFTRGKPDHDARRSIWTSALSSSAITSYRDRINRQIDVLVQRISEAAVPGEPILVNDLLYWFAFDSMGEFAFNQDFGMMQHQEWHFAIKLFGRALSIIGPFAPVVWLIKIGFAFLPWFGKIKDWFSMLSFCRQRMEDRMKTRPQERDVSSFFIEAAEKDGHANNKQKWLKGDAATVVVAGSDTTAPTLVFLLFCIARHPLDADKIYTELTGVDPLDLDTLSTLPHLNGAIHEAMRLYSVAPSTVSRQTPPQGVTVGSTTIPGNTKVLIPRWVIFNREDCFVHSHEFIPERWYSKPELVKQRKAFAPFGKGRSSCVGQGLATTQIRLVLASIVKKFHLHFLPGDDGTSVVKDMRDQLTAKPGELRLIFEPRKSMGESM